VEENGCARVMKGDRDKTGLLSTRRKTCRGIGILPILLAAIVDNVKWRVTPEITLIQLFFWTVSDSIAVFADARRGSLGLEIMFRHLESQQKRYSCSMQ
jgi:hypothetical protein